MCQDSDFVAAGRRGLEEPGHVLRRRDQRNVYSVATVADTVDEASGDVTVTVGLRHRLHRRFTPASDFGHGQRRRRPRRHDRGGDLLLRHRVARPTEFTVTLSSETLAGGRAQPVERRLRPWRRRRRAPRRPTSTCTRQRGPSIEPGRTVVLTLARPPMCTPSPTVSIDASYDEASGDGHGHQDQGRAPATLETDSPSSA